MTDEELIARLRGDMPEMRPNRGWGWREDIDLVAVEAERKEAADHIEALVKDRDEALEWLSASQGYIADAVFALDKQEKAEAKLAAMEAIATQWKARAERLEAALRWYEARVSDCRKITREGDTARHELDRDGGQIARAALKGADHE